jgi:hypothetical protein
VLGLLTSVVAVAALAALAWLGLRRSHNQTLLKLRRLAGDLQQAARALASGGQSAPNTFHGPLVEESEGLKKTARLLERLEREAGRAAPQVADPPDGNWFRAGLAQHALAFQEDRKLLDEIERAMSEILQTKYTNQDLRSLSVLWAGAVGFQPDLMLEIGRSVGGTTIALTLARRHCPGVRGIVSVDLDNTGWEKTSAHFGARIDRTDLEILTHDGRYLPWRELVAQARRPLIVIDAHDTPGVRLMERLIDGLLEPALAGPFLALVHDLPRETEARGLENVPRPRAWDSVGFVNRLWTGEWFWGFAEAVPFVEWANRRRVRLRLPHTELMRDLPDAVRGGLPEAWLAPGEPYTTWVSFSHLDVERA